MTIYNSFKSCQETHRCEEGKKDYGKTLLEIYALLQSQSHGDKLNTFLKFTEWFLFFSGNCQNYKNPYLVTGPFFMSMFSILVDNKLQLFRKYKTKNKKDTLYVTYFSQVIPYQFIPFFSKTNRTIYTNMSLNHALTKYIKPCFVITILFTIYLFINQSINQSVKQIYMAV